MKEYYCVRIRAPFWKPDFWTMFLHDVFADKDDAKAWGKKHRQYSEDRHDIRLEWKVTRATPEEVKAATTVHKGA